MRHRRRKAGLLPVCTGLVLALQLSSARGLVAQGGSGPPKHSIEAPAPPTRLLYRSGQVKFGTQGPGAVLAGVQCDTDGNVYFRAYPSIVAAQELVHEGALPGLTKLSLDSAAVVRFPVDTPSGYASSYSHGFYVSPRGEVYGLVVASRHGRDFHGPNWADNIVVKYNDDGTVDQTVKLEPPSGVHFIADRLAVFLDGSILAAGEMLVGPGRPEAGALTAVFDRGGGFVTSLSLQHDVGAQERNIGGGKPEKRGSPRGAAIRWLVGVRMGLMVGSPDGTVYLLRASAPARAYVLGSGGKVLRAFDIKPPRPAMQPTQASVTEGGNLLLLFSGSPYASEPHFPNALALVNPATGRVTSTYDIPQGAGIPACATAEDEFLFLRSDKGGSLEVAKFVPR